MSAGRLSPTARPALCLGCSGCAGAVGSRARRFGAWALEVSGTVAKSVKRSRLALSATSVSAIVVLALKKLAK